VVVEADRRTRAGFANVPVPVAAYAAATEERDVHRSHQPLANDM
jgi:hypothetical protein